jgi:hypothetical protein
LASLTGEVWADTNANGIRDASESGVIDARVYLDVNDDQQFSPDEPFVRTDSTGQYLFEPLPAGDNRFSGLPRSRATMGANLDCLK